MVEAALICKFNMQICVYLSCLHKLCLNVVAEQTIHVPPMFRRCSG